MSRPFIAVPNTVSVELIYSNASEINENVFHAYKGSPFSASDIVAIRNVFNSWEGATVATIRSASSTLVRIRTKALDSLGSPMEDFSLPTPRAGSVGSAVAPLSAALCIKLSTGLTGRSYRGRTYFGNLTTASMTDAGHWAAATATFFATAINTLKTNLASAGFTLCVTSYRTSGAWRTTGVNTPVLNGVAIDTAIDSQRRRLVGRGHSF